MTENKRQKQVARQIHKDLSDIFQKDLKTVFDGAFVTITDVKVSPDLSLARVYLSFMLTNDKEGVLEKIKENNKKIRALFGNKTRHQFRIIPNFHYFIDDTAEYAQKIEELFANINIPPASENEEDDTIYTR